MKSLFYILIIVPLFVCTCGKVPVKQYFILNYLPSSERNRISQGPYPFIIRVREFNIEEAYNRPQIVYRQSPFSIQYYVYRVWAVKPERMITDLIYKHLITSNLVGTVVRRFDEGKKPDYELSGMVEAVEEYDSDELWFAHLAIRFNLTRISDGRVVYTRRFDNRKRVFQQEPEYVIREMSTLMEFIMTQVIHDIDVKLAAEFGYNVAPELEHILPPEFSDSTITGVSE
ncbi:MAG: membrane integrity-associated transporter subunit PqiC [Chitinispirillaceae bacterium]|nr:membrane integrity-associated transporter subunit PqiC [Chitinispirillaceae bacterium]